MPEIRATLAAALASAALLAGCNLGGGGEPKNSDVGVGAGNDWTAPNAAADETAYSRLDQVNSGNVSRLGLAWSLDLPGEVTLEATPIEVAGTVYFSGTLSTVYAVDAATGKLKWKYDPEIWKHNPLKMHFTFGVNRGVAYDGGKIFVGTMDGRLIALDAASGKQMWSVETTDPKAGQTITGAPRTFNGMVMIGNGGADFGARGYLTAYDQASGQQRWRFYVVPAGPDKDKGDPVMEAAAKTWSADFWKKTGGGGGPWGHMTFDPELNRVYVGTGNAAPYQPDIRSPGGGDNLYTASIVALDAKTGKYLWHYQLNPRDSWDYDSTQQISLATLNIDGKPRKVLMQAPKNGFFYVIDRQSGKLVSAGKTTKISWATSIDTKTGRPNEEPNIRYETGEVTIWPGSVGGHDWQAQSYSPRTGLTYVPVHQIGARFSTKGGPASDEGMTVMGLSVEPKEAGPGDGKGTLVAWDPVAQKARWTVQQPTLWNGGALSTAGNLVFQGTADGWLHAYDAGNGKPLWRFNAGLGIVAAPMSYSVGGKQYVSLLVGYGGTAASYGKPMDAGWKYGVQPRRLLTFALDGKATLPPSPPADFTVHALDDPKLVLNDADVQAGRGAFIQCAACHGVGLHSTGAPGPDLRESAIALRLDTFTELVKGGSRMANGMPNFTGFLTDQQIKQVWSYIRAQSRAALGKRP
ncbi:MAG: PQQ-dependent dehydrogenase, methanol/ethanol family, partial [Novosphingobium sp.]|nr:PQQ-dependent dehydrogenase, methanol/ethanol family [Novosphingobium sp.]